MFLTYRSPIFAKYYQINHKQEVFLTFSDQLSFARKQKKMKQADLGKAVGTSGDIIGKYERGENTPSIEVASKMTDALEVSLDFLLGKTFIQMNKANIKRLEDIEALPEEYSTHSITLLKQLN